LLEKYANFLSRFLAAEEKIVTPYQFGVYDLLVLPPSFPYGGMVGDIYILEPDTVPDLVSP
jgi:leukotriene-A4 hydrolase